MTGTTVPHPASPDEQARQRKLDAYRLVDTLPESSYDDIVRIASALCDAPTALMTLVDRDRQWFKARIGMDAGETPRDIAFCDRAIGDPDRPLVVEDAVLDARFAANPLVTGATGIRFYAGVPLRAPTGEALGTVCVIDRVPRTLDDTQLAGLEALARLAVVLMEAHRDRLQRARDDSGRALEAARPDATPTRGLPTGPATDTGAVAIVRLQHGAGGVALVAADAAAQLAAIAAAMREALAPGDIVGPHGAHELLIVLADVEDAAARLDCAHRAGRAAARSASLDVPGQVTMGAAVANGRGQAMESLFLRADDALADARAAGGDCAVVLEG